MKNPDYPQNPEMWQAAHINHQIDPFNPAMQVTRDLYKAPQQVQIVEGIESYGNKRNEVQGWLNQGYRVLQATSKIVSYSMSPPDAPYPSPPIVQTYVCFILVKD